MALLDQIDRGEVVLPAIQRDFVWREDRMAALMDSVMRGYPVGMVFLWESYDDILYRRFEKDYIPGRRPSWFENSSERPARLRLVLDGQQRLQSLYLSVYGTYRGRRMYLDLLSGGDGTDPFGRPYVFRFLDDAEAEEANDAAVRRGSDVGGKHLFVGVDHVVAMSSWERHRFLEGVKSSLQLTEDEVARAEVNVSRLKEALQYESNILKVAVIDENKPRYSRERKTKADVLEAFVRINQGGTRLTQSELLFSFLKLHWDDTARFVPAKLAKLNEGHYFNFDVQFLLTAVALATEPSLLAEPDGLRKVALSGRIKGKLRRCLEALAEVVRLVVGECSIRNPRLVGGRAALLPLLCYALRCGGRLGDGEGVRRALFFFGFSGFLSRGGRRRLARLVGSVVDRGTDRFPLEEVMDFAAREEGPVSWGAELYGRNKPLLYHLVQAMRGADVRTARGIPRLAPIFPPSLLVKEGVSREEADHFANFWALPRSAAGARQQGEAMESFYSTVPEEELRLALVDRSLLRHDRYREFLRERSRRLCHVVAETLGLER